MFANRETGRSKSKPEVTWRNRESVVCGISRTICPYFFFLVPFPYSLVQIIIIIIIIIDIIIIIIDTIIIIIIAVYTRKDA